MNTQSSSITMNDREKNTRMVFKLIILIEICRQKDFSFKRHSRCVYANYTFHFSIYYFISRTSMTMRVSSFCYN